MYRISYPSANLGTANLSLAVTTFGTLQIEFHPILAEQWAQQAEANLKLKIPNALLTLNIHNFLSRRDGTILIPDLESPRKTAYQSRFLRFH
jgi:hypothetical protein